MSWPEVAVHSYVPPLSADWAYVQDVPASSYSARVTSGWEWDTLRTSSNDPIIPHLLFSDIGIVAKRKHWIVQFGGSAQAIWNGPVSLANPSVSLGLYGKDWLVLGSVVSPITSYPDAPLHQPTKLADITASYGKTFRGSLGLSSSSRLSPHGAVGVKLGWLRAEVFGQAFPEKVEASVSGVAHSDCWTVTPSAAVGLLPGVGNAKLRGQLTIQWGCRPPKSTPAEIVIPLIAPVEPAPPVENAVPVPTGIFPTPKESIAGFLSFNETVLVFIRTNLPKEEADTIIADLAANKGLPMEQIDHVEYVDARENDPGYLDFVVIRGNKAK